MVQCDKTNRRKTLDEFALEAEGNEEEASLSLFDLLCIGMGRLRKVCRQCPPAAQIY